MLATNLISFICEFFFNHPSLARNVELIGEIGRCGCGSQESQSTEEFVTATETVQERSSINTLPTIRNTFDRTNLSQIMCECNISAVSRRPHTKHNSFDSNTRDAAIFSFVNLADVSKRPYRTFSHFGFVLPMFSSLPFHYHYPTTMTLTKYQPLSQHLSTDELFSTPLYVTCPDRMVPKLLKYKKDLQEQFRENKLCDSSEASAFIQEMRINHVETDNTDQDAENELNAQTVRDIVEEIIAKVLPIEPETSQIGQISHQDSQPCRSASALPTPQKKLLSRDMRLHRKAQFMEFWQENEANFPSSHNSSLVSEHSQSFAILTDREQKLLAEINESKLDEEDEIFVKIRDSLLSKFNRRTDLCLYEDGSCHEPELANASASQSFHTSTPNEKSSESPSTPSPLQISKVKAQLFEAPLETETRTVAKQPKVNVKVNITRTTVVKGKKAEDVAPVPSPSPRGAKNFILENIRAAALPKSKILKTTGIGKSRIGKSRSKQNLTKTARNDDVVSREMEGNKGHSPSIRSFMKGKSASGSPNLWISASFK